MNTGDILKNGLLADDVVDVNFLYVEPSHFRVARNANAQVISVVNSLQEEWAGRVVRPASRVEAERARNAIRLYAYWNLRVERKGEAAWGINRVLIDTPLGHGINVALIRS